MTAVSAAVVKRVCHERIAHFSNHHTPQWHGSDARQLAALSQIVYRNYTRGRAHHTMRIPDERALSRTDLIRYADLVVGYYSAKSDLVARLQAGDEASWETLKQQLYATAYRYLWRRSAASYGLHDEASDYAQATCGIVGTRAYPYDVAFEAWTGTILRNCIRQDLRSPDVLDHGAQLISLDYMRHSAADHCETAWHESLESRDASVSFTRVEAQDELLRGLAHLRSATQRAVLSDTYLVGLSDEQIAQRIRKPMGTVQVLRHRALRSLRQILLELNAP